MGRNFAITNEEAHSRIFNARQSGLDVYSDDKYINAITPMKFYCSKGHFWSAKIGNITHNHQGCPYCCGRLPIIGETDMWTTDPTMASLLLNPEDGYTHTCSSSAKLDFKCPNCGHVSRHIVANIHKRGLACPKCADGISYPEKFMASVLDQIKVNYEAQYYPKWSDNRRYDFYLKDFNLILEIQGRQHYESWTRSERSLLEEQINDAYKKELALKNGVDNYVCIDAKCSDIKYLSNSIKHSELANFIKLDDINWIECGYYASGSLVKKSAELYNIGYNTSDIALMLHYSKSTILRWLKTATELDMCNYIPSKGFLNDKSQIVCLNTNEVFASMSDAHRKYNIPIANISKVCLFKRKYAGIHPDTGEPMVWRYLNDYDNNEIIDFMSLLNPHTNYKSKSNTQQND